LWRNVVLAVRYEHRRQGYGRQLKRKLIELARDSEVLAITSVVAWDNKPMLELNRQLGGSIVQMPAEQGVDREFALCIVPVLAIV